jgi:hypothetical protein
MERSFLDARYTSEDDAEDEAHGATCPKCHGLGSDENATFWCSYCKGTGGVILEDEIAKAVARASEPVVDAHSDRDLHMHLLELFGAVEHCIAEGIGSQSATVKDYVAAIRKRLGPPRTFEESVASRPASTTNRAGGATDG